MGFRIRGRDTPKSKTYPGEVGVDAIGYQESLANYPVRSVLTLE